MLCTDGPAGHGLWVACTGHGLELRRQTPERMFTYPAPVPGGLVHGTVRAWGQLCRPGLWGIPSTAEWPGVWGLPSPAPSTACSRVPRSGPSEQAVPPACCVHPVLKSVPPADPCPTLWP